MKLTLLILLFSTLCSAVAANDRPNFVIWVADDQYLHSVGCYGGNPEHTPNIDKLASEGMKPVK
ncbi:MAG: hypothetical protein CMM01_18120 [Rhodopirellula sp.]|nr:hypothetical protein [Rhodopirellula sp.]